MKYLIHIALIGYVAFAYSANPVLVKQVEKTKKVHEVNASIKTEEYRLPNGLTIFLTPNPKAPNVHVAHWVKAGSLHETPGITGIAHLFEHMMFRPLKPGAPSYSDIVSKLGADYNASTRFESTYYYSAAAPEYLDALLKAESQRFQNLVVTKELLDVERKAVWSEYSVKFDANPMIDLWFQIYQRAFVGHPLGWMIIGFREDLEKITAENCNEFYKKYYKPNNIGLFITGNFKKEDALKRIARYYSDWKPGTNSTLPADYNFKTEEIVAEGKLPSEAKFLLFGFRTPFFNKDNAKVATLVNYILFDSENGLVKKRLVDDKKIVASVSEFNFEYDNGMMKAGFVGLPTTKLSDVKKEMNLIKKDFESMTPELFETYKKNLFINIGENIQRNSKIANLLVLSWGKYGDIGLAHDFARGSLNISKEQVQQFLNQHFNSNNFVYMTHKGQGK